MKTRFFLFFILAISGIHLNAQISRGGKPMESRSDRFFLPVYSTPETWIFSRFQAFKRQESASDGKKNLSFAADFPLDISPQNSGKWEFSKEGYKIWRMRIKSAGAKAISVFFDDFRLEEGSSVFIYAPGKEVVLGGFNHMNNKKGSVLNTAYIPGDELIIELQVALGMEYGSLRIGSVSHAFIDVLGSSDFKDGYFGRSGDCERDINCAEGDNWQTVKNAVARVIFKRNGFTTELCTGALINNTASDGKAFFYTANHCINKASEAESAVLYFGYESEVCEGDDGDISMTLSGAELIATSDSLDFSLLLLSEEPPEDYSPFFAGWSISRNPANQAVAIHHPRGDVRKISLDSDPLTAQYQDINPPSWLENGSIPSAFWRVVNWETGATEGGSSGCPLFNENQLIVGNLTGGDASCTNPVNDYFSKFFMDWDYYPDPGRQLKYWLDSLNTGQLFVRGIDPYNIIPEPEIERFELYPNPGNGVYTLHTDDLSLSGGELWVYNLSGSLIANYDLGSSDSFIFDIGSFENGTYILKVQIEGITEYKKIIMLK